VVKYGLLKTVVKLGNYFLPVFKQLAAVIVGTNILPITANYRRELKPIRSLKTGLNLKLTLQDLIGFL
jgi:hypothetical protein